MNRLCSVKIFIVLLITVGFISCSDDKELESGISGQSWTEGKALDISAGEPLSVTFSAKEKWTASSSESWCEPTQAGNAGESRLELFVSTATNAARTTTITINVSGYAPVSFAVAQKPEEAMVGDVELNRKVDAYLKEMYLWNDEYKGLSLNFAQNYDDFFYGALGSMKTNTLDKRGNTLFSFIEKRTAINSRSTKYVKKELRYNFGITGMFAANITEIGICFIVRGVYPESSAASAGIKRGTIITRINGQKITESNYRNLYYELYIPTSTRTIEITDYKDNKITITSKPTYASPIIMKQVKEVDGRKIGYLVYSEFDAGYDDELFEAFNYFKSENISDLILDLRYNGGGNVISANLIASCIAGSAAQEKVFVQYRYNEERMKKHNNKRAEELFSYSNYANLGTSLEAGGLNLSRVYCLVGNGTASASELVINSLRGIDVEVVLIGEKTTGKNVGMEYEDIAMGNDSYRVAPITFQSYNAKGFGDYAAGFSPNLAIDELNPKNEANAIYLYRDYGTSEEFLYAAAVQMITGKEATPNTRSLTGSMRAATRALPQILKPGHGGMLKRYESQQ